MIAQYGDELAELETKDNGWVIRETKYGLIPILASIWYDAAAATDVGSKGRNCSTWTEYSSGYTIREPYGVVVGIIPGIQLLTFTVKAASALAAEIPLLLNHLVGSLASLCYGEIIQSVLPPGVLMFFLGRARSWAMHSVSTRK